jgi:hypothetical protein
MSAMMAYFIAFIGQFQNREIHFARRPSFYAFSSRIKPATRRRGWPSRKASSSSSIAFGDEFDATVGQVTHVAGDFKSGGDGFGGVTEADALHAA